MSELNTISIENWFRFQKKTGKYPEDGMQRRYDRIVRILSLYLQEEKA